jgi:probable F420-dependent oxidoreductase
MKFGVTAFINDKAAMGIVQFATTAERLGFESIWLGEHDHLPVNTVHPWVDGGRPPDVYKRFPDPFTLLAAAAGVTKHLRLGTSVSLIAEHNPIYLAKQIATLDWLSGGRVELGVGYGWNKLEMINNSIDPKRPRAVFREKLAALKALWTEETPAFSGEFVNFTESWSYPKPVQQPWPPIIIGAALTPATKRDLVERADGWMPIRTMMSFERLAAEIAEVRRLAEEAGRDPLSIEISLLDPDGAMGGKKSLEAFEKRLPSGDLLERYKEIGVDRCIYAVPERDPGLLQATIELLAERLELRGQPVEAAR